MNAMETLQQVAEHMSIASTLNYRSKILKSSTDHKWWGIFSNFMGEKFTVKN